MEKRKITPSLEDYLETLWELGPDDPVRVTDIALHLDISKASVNHAMTTLKDMGLVLQPRYGTLSLTKEGMTRAQEVRVRHEMIMDFLQRGLGVSPDVAEMDACRIEHVISEQTLECIAAFMRTAEKERDIYTQGEGGFIHG